MYVSKVKPITCKMCGLRLIRSRSGSQSDEEMLAIHLSMFSSEKCLIDYVEDDLLTPVGNYAKTLVITPTIHVKRIQHGQWRYFVLGVSPSGEVIQIVSFGVKKEAMDSAEKLRKITK